MSGVLCLNIMWLCMCMTLGCSQQEVTQQQSRCAVAHLQVRRAVHHCIHKAANGANVAHNPSRRFTWERSQAES